MIRKSITLGAIGCALVLIPAYWYGWLKFTEEPEFGSIIGFGVIFAGTVIGISILGLSIITGVIRKRRQTTREQSTRSGSDQRD